MTRLAYGLMGLFGVGMALLAAVMMMRADSQDKLASQRVRLQTAVTSLAPCVSCHTGSEVIFYNNTTISHSGYFEDTLPAGLESTASPTTPLQSDIDRSLYDLGQRILALPDTAGQKPVVEAFLRVYDESRDWAGSEIPLSLFQQLQMIEQQIRLLENRAQPDQWAVSNRVPIPAAAWQILASPTPVTVMLSIVLLLVLVSTSWSLCEREQPVIPSRSVRAAHRRGPPARMAVESVSSTF